MCLIKPSELYFYITSVNEAIYLFTQWIWPREDNFFVMVKAKRCCGVPTNPD